jgi:midasin (ATPase involved in ribosome maturation)
MSYYFYTGKLEKGKISIYPLPGQGLDVTCRVSCSKTIRSSSTDTIYFSYRHPTTVSLSSGATYYKGRVYVVSDTTATVIKDEYKKLMESLEIKKEKVEEVEIEVEDRSTKTEEPVIEEKEEVITLYKTLSKDSYFKAPTSKDDGFFMQSNDWKLLARNIKKQVNTLILGPAGTGKTSCIKILCERLGLNLHVFDMGSMLDPISSLLGVHRLEGGESVFDYANFTKVIQEPGVILLDELSRAPQTAMNILFPCLDERRSLSVEIACGKGVRDIKIHPEVTFIATANVGAEYSGTNSMDRALVNRFFPLELNYIPETEEVDVLVKRTNIKSDLAKIIVKIANNIRSLAKKQELSCCPSVRESLMVAELVSDGWSIGDAMQAVYLPIYEGTKVEGERSTVFKLLTSY